MKKIFLFLTIVILSGVIFTSCKSKGNRTGRIFMPDMTYSNAYETYSSTKFQFQTDTNAMSAKLPISNTIPKGYLPDNPEIRNNESKLMAYLFKNYFKNPVGNPDVDDNAQRSMAANMLSNPVKLSDNVLAEGKEKYDIYCAVCHGKKGNGDGVLITRADGSDGPYTAIPPSYEKRLPEISDGEIFYSISYGKNMMGGYYSQVNPEDRWKIVHYIKNLAGIEETSENKVATINISEIEVKVGSEFNVPDIYYNTGSADLQNESYAVLDQLISFFNQNSNVVVEIGSHADSRGDVDKNMQLSERRAQSVVKYLKSKGVANSQLKAVGYGSTKPAVDCGSNCTNEQHAKNRRTTFKIIEVN